MDGIPQCTVDKTAGSTIIDVFKTFFSVKQRRIFDEFGKFTLLWMRIPACVT